MAPTPAWLCPKYEQAIQVKDPIYVGSCLQLRLLQKSTEESTPNIHTEGGDGTGLPHYVYRMTAERNLGTFR